MLNNKQFNRFYQLISEYDDILLFRHVGPDGDALGSQFGLKKSLELTFPKKHFFAIGEKDTPKNLRSFFPSFDEYEVNPEKDFLAIVLDVPNEERINSELYKQASKVIKIDHHPVVDTFEDLFIGDISYSSTCEIVMHILKVGENKMKFSKKASKYLTIGTITDTNRFAFPSVTKQTLELSSLHYPQQDITNIIETISNKSIEDFQILAKIISKTKYIDNVAIFIMSKSFSKKYNFKKGAKKLFVNELLTPKETEYLLFASFDFEKKKWKGSLRSKRFPINELAIKFHGGGHEMASGFMLENKSELKEMTKELLNLAKANKEKND